MSKLVEELKKQHAALLGAVEASKNVSIDSPEGKNAVMGIKQALLAHLKREDTELYPALQKAAEEDHALKGKLFWFSENIAAVSKEALEFFDKYSKPGTGSFFAQDFGRLAAALKSRIQKEETTLYPEYDKLVR